MAYAFNEDRSKVEVYSKQQSDSIESITNARIDTLVNSGFGGIEVREELWTSVSGVIGRSISLSDDPDNYDCLELVVGDSPIKKIARIPVTGGVVDISTGVGPNDVKISSVQITRNGDKLSVSSADELEYTGSWSYSASGSTIPKIYAVYGIKYAQDCSTEVSDARVGVDGTLYSSAGDAIRAQIEDLENGPADSLVTPRYIDGFKFDGSSDIVRLFTTDSAADVRSKVITYPDSWSGVASTNEKFNIQTNGTIFFVQFKNGHDFGGLEEQSLELSFPNYQSSSTFALPIVVNGQYTNHLEEDFTIPPNAIVAFMTVISNSTRCAQVLSVS